MKDSVHSAFRYAEEQFIHFVNENGFLSDFRSGVTVAFSGGADSVLLLILMDRLSKSDGFRLSAVHVHHGIRGDEADGDAAFCEQLCDKKKIPFLCVRVDAPALARKNGCGIEEAARILRYRAIDDAVRHFSAGVAVTAHHAGDNLETMLFHLARGTGITGLSGIPPRRGLYRRPLLLLRKHEILSALSEAGQSFVQDSTNDDGLLTRNFIRKEIIPPLLSRMPHAEISAMRAATLLRRDADYLDGVAETFLDMHYDGNVIPRVDFSNLHPAIASRVFLLAEKRAFDKKNPVPEQNHVEKVISLARSGNTDFCVSLPGGVSVIGERDRIYFRCETVLSDTSEIPLVETETVTPDREILVVRGGSTSEFMIREKNVYKLLKQISLNRDTINRDLYLRHRRNGDAYSFGGMRRRLKTLLGDAKMSASEKNALWILCDKDGILWVPGFGVRDGSIGSDGEVLAFYRKEKTVTT